MIQPTPEGEAALATLAAILSAALIDAPAALLPASGPSALDMLLDPFPSLAHSRVAFEVWLRFRCALLTSLFGSLHEALVARAAPLSEAHVKALAALYRRVLRLQAIMLHPVDEQAAPPLPPPPSALASPNVALVAAAAAADDDDDDAGADADAPPPPHADGAPPQTQTQTPQTPPPLRLPAAPALPADGAQRGAPLASALTDRLPHAELLAVVLIVVERGVGDDRNTVRASNLPRLA